MCLQEPVPDCFLECVERPLFLCFITKILSELNLENRYSFSPLETPLNKKKKRRNTYRFQDNIVLSSSKRERQI